MKLLFIIWIIVVFIKINIGKCESKSSIYEQYQKKIKESLDNTRPRIGDSLTMPMPIEISKEDFVYTKMLEVNEKPLDPSKNKYETDVQLSFDDIKNDLEGFKKLIDEFKLNPLEPVLPKRRLLNTNKLNEIFASQPPPLKHGLFHGEFFKSTELSPDDKNDLEDFKRPIDEVKFSLLDPVSQPPSLTRRRRILGENVIRTQFKPIDSSTDDKYVINDSADDEITQVYTHPMIKETCYDRWALDDDCKKLYFIAYMQSIKKESKLKMIPLTDSQTFLIQQWAFNFMVHRILSILYDLLEEDNYVNTYHPASIVECMDQTIKDLSFLINEKYL